MFQFIQKYRDVFYYYDNGEICESSKLPNISNIWNFQTFLNDLENVNVMEINLKGNEEHQYFSEIELKNYEYITKRKSAYLKSLKNSHSNFSKVPILKLIPNSLLLELFQMRDLLVERVEIIEEYEILFKIFKIIKNLESLNLLGFHKSNKISYNPFKVKTGRMSLDKGFFPILTLKKELRKNIQSRNGLFYELDYNAADIRTLSGLLQIPQCEDDCYEMLKKHSQDRDLIKKEFYGWLYNPQKKDKHYEKMFNLEYLKKAYFQDSKIKTLFGRKIETDEKRWISHLIQSTSSDVFFEQVFEIWKFLRNYKSKICFMLHDSVTIDVFKDETYIIPKLLEIFNNTRFGIYHCTHLKSGTNFGEMKVCPNINEDSI